MLLKIKHLLVSNNYNKIMRCLVSTKVNYLINDTFRTVESNPTNHSTQHLAMFYTIPTDIYNKLFILGGFSKEQQKMLKSFNETSIMIRSASIELLNYLNSANYSRSVNRYVLYGAIGCGKTFALNHALHFGYTKQFLLVHCPDPTDWVLYPDEHSPSQFRDKRIDTPIDAAVWLQQFKTQNHQIIDDLDLKASRTYTWSQREITECGEPIKNIIDHGINRIKHASDCMAVILKEIKAQSSSSKFRVLVIVDKVNSFYEKSKVKYADRSVVPVNNITIARAFKKLFTNDWKNGAVIASVDKKLIVPYRIFPVPDQNNPRHKPKCKPLDKWGPFTVTHLSDLPKDLLTNEGFKDFDPFIPIEVTTYSEKEAENCLDYYNDRKWIQRPEAKTDDGRMEIKFLNSFNPELIYNFCSTL